MSRVVHFEIQAADPERAMRFYTDLFDWRFNKFAGPLDYWLIVTGSPDQPGIDGGLLRRNGPPPGEGQPVNAFVCTIDVPSLDACLSAARKRGATLAVDKMAVPGVGWLAYLKDTEGNIFGIMQSDPAAK
jgi:uncharacterized protein